MIQGDFHGSVGSESVGFSEGQFRFGVESFHRRAGKGSFGMEPVQQQGAMTAQHAGDFLHGLESRTHGARAPSVEELPSPVRRDAMPEKLEILLQQVGSDRTQVVVKQLGQARLLLLGEVLRALEQQPAGVLQHRLA